MKTLLAPLCFVLCLGCASVRQEATTTATDPISGVVTVTRAKSSIIASGDSKTIVDKVRASAGKTSSVGAQGVAEENNLSQLIEAAANGISKLLEASFAAGKAAGSPVVTIP